MKPITDKAEIAIDFPDKAYFGAFTRHSGFSAAFDGDGLILKLASPGAEKRTVEIHLHYCLLADILAELARGAKAAPIDDTHRAPLLAALSALHHNLSEKSRKSDNKK